MSNVFIRFARSFTAGLADIVPVSPLDPLPVTLSASGLGVTPDYAAVSSIAAGGTAQSLFASNATRRAFVFQNLSDTAMWIKFGGTASAAAGSTLVQAGAYYEPLVAPTTAISVFCATTGKAFTSYQA